MRYSIHCPCCGEILEIFIDENNNITIKHEQIEISQDEIKQVLSNNKIMFG